MVAVYSDETSIEVTPIARFVPADTSVVALDTFGMIRATRPGKTVVTATFQHWTAMTAVSVQP